MILTQEDLEMIQALLAENGISCTTSHDSLYVIPESIKPSTTLPLRTLKLYLFHNFQPFQSGCRRPDIADPNFIEDTKDLIKKCNGDCVKCYRNVYDRH